MLSLKGVGFPTPLACPECHKKLHIKVGKNGHFLACSGYPECSYSRDYIRDEKGKIQPIDISEVELSDKVCKKCAKPMVVKQGKFGDFLACSGYPDCKKTRSVKSKSFAASTGVKCPEKDCDGELVERTSKRGKVFYGCSRFPKCTFASWDKPIAKSCTQCSAEIMVEKETKRDGKVLKCLDKDCGYKESAE